MMCPYMFYITGLLHISIWYICLLVFNCRPSSFLCFGNIVMCESRVFRNPVSHTCSAHTYQLLPCSGPRNGWNPSLHQACPVPPRRQEHQCSFWDQTEKMRDRNILSTPWLPWSSFSRFPSDFIWGISVPHFFSTSHPFSFDQGPLRNIKLLLVPILEMKKLRLRKKRSTLITRWLSWKKASWKTTQYSGKKQWAWDENFWHLWKSHSLTPRYRSQDGTWTLLWELWGKSSISGE